MAIKPTDLLTDVLLLLRDSATDKVLANIQKFWDSRDKFVTRKQIFKRGVLLWGPAGGGKTSTVMLLARDIINRNGIVTITQNPSLASDGLSLIRKIEPHRPIVNIIEDIDEIMSKFGERHLLSMLDGEAQVDNIFHVASTNFPERLGARLAKRPSRFDEIVYVGAPSEANRRAFLEAKTFPNELNGSLEKWVSDTAGMSLAFLRELIVATFCLCRPYEETLMRLRIMSKEMKPITEFERRPVGI